MRLGCEQNKFVVDRFWLDEDNDAARVRFPILK